MQTTTTAKRRKAESWRSALSLVLLLAFSIQSFLVQTHVHALALGAPLSPAAVSTSHETQAPFDADKCVLCQEFVHAGNYVLPGGLAVLPPTAHISLLPFELAPVVAARVISHDWMGRAPPRA